MQDLIHRLSQFGIEKNNSGQFADECVCGGEVRDIEHVEIKSKIAWLKRQYASGPHGSAVATETRMETTRKYLEEIEEVLRRGATMEARIAELMRAVDDLLTLVVHQSRKPVKDAAEHAQRIAAKVGVELSLWR